MILSINHVFIPTTLSDQKGSRVLQVTSCGTQATEYGGSGSHPETAICTPSWRGVGERLGLLPLCQGTHS